MSAAEVLDLARDGVMTLIYVSGPMMLVGLAVGVSIGLLQALTQVQEMTLVFVPKIIAIFITFMVTLPFMGGLLSAYMERVAVRIISG